MKFRLLLLVLALTFCARPGVQHGAGSATSSSPGDQLRDDQLEVGEYIAWEKTIDDTPAYHYKQIRKDYSMGKETCRNVIQVLADGRPSERSATYVEFECWPASLNPTEYYRKYSIYSDEPRSVVIPTKR